MSDDIDKKPDGDAPAPASTPAPGDEAPPQETDSERRSRAVSTRRMRSAASDRATVIVRICLIVGLVALATFLIWDFIASRAAPDTPLPVISELDRPMPKRDMAPGGWLHGLKRVKRDVEKPWQMIGLEAYRRKLKLPVSARGAALKGAFLSIALFTDDTFVKLRAIQPGNSRAIVCADKNEKYGAVRKLFQRCTAGGSPVTHILVRTGNEPAAAPITLGALPLVAGARRVSIVVTTAGDGYKIVARTYECKGCDDLKQKLDMLRAGKAPVLVKVAAADDLPLGAFMDVLNACLYEDEPVYVALQPLE